MYNGSEKLIYLNIGKISNVEKPNNQKGNIIIALKSVHKIRIVWMKQNFIYVRTAWIPVSDLKI